MDTRAPFDDPEWTTPSIPDPIERRLAAIEERLDAIEGSLRSEIAQDLQAASEEMRRAVSELGRLLLRDLGRLTRVLGEHRDEIVERLLSYPVETVPATEASQRPEPVPPSPSPGLVELPRDDAASVPAPVETQALTGEDGRWRVPVRRRRRSPKPPSARDTEKG